VFRLVTKACEKDRGLGPCSAIPCNIDQHNSFFGQKKTQVLGEEKCFPI
jgi:hypothetical protein